MRKDFASVSSARGRPKQGFELAQLIRDIEAMLGYHNADHAVLVGVGSLGRAFLQYGGFSLDERLIRLLCAVSESGSLRSACAAGGISYSRAWLLLGEAERAIGAPLLVRKLGGASGGGSELTEEARTLIATYQRIASSLNKEAAHILEKEFTT